MDTLYICFVITLIGLVCGDTACPDEWMPFQGSCYLFGHEQRLKFIDAEHLCTMHNANLVHVDDVHENNFIRDMLSRFKPNSYWLGLTDQVIEGEWRLTVTDSAPEYTDWSPGEPESAQGTANEDCAAFYQPLSFHWVDADCNAAFQPVCEKSGSHSNNIVG